MNPASRSASSVRRCSTAISIQIRSHRTGRLHVPIWQLPCRFQSWPRTRTFPMSSIASRRFELLSTSTMKASRSCHSSIADHGCPKQPSSPICILAARSIASVTRPFSLPCRKGPSSGTRSKEDSMNSRSGSLTFTHGTRKPAPPWLSVVKHTSGSNSLRMSLRSSCVAPMNLSGRGPKACCLVSRSMKASNPNLVRASYRRPRAPRVAVTTGRRMRSQRFRKLSKSSLGRVPWVTR